MTAWSRWREQRAARRRARRTISCVMAGCRRSTWFERTFAGRPRLLGLALGIAGAAIATAVAWWSLLGR